MESTGEDNSTPAGWGRSPPIGHTTLTDAPLTVDVTPANVATIQLTRQPGPVLQRDGPQDEVCEAYRMPQAPRGGVSDSPGADPLGLCLQTDSAHLLAQAALHGPPILALALSP